MKECLEKIIQKTYVNGLPRKVIIVGHAAANGLQAMKVLGVDLFDQV
jgi:hypothetical protein